LRNFLPLQNNQAEKITNFSFAVKKNKTPLHPPSAWLFHPPKGGVKVNGHGGGRLACAGGMSIPEILGP